MGKTFKTTDLTEFSNRLHETRKQNENVIVYFDMDKKSFRSFVKESFVGAY